jgi:hypothetical protein
MVDLVVASFSDIFVRAIFVKFKNLNLNRIFLKNILYILYIAGLHSVGTEKLCAYQKQVFVCLYTLMV